MLKRGFNGFYGTLTSLHPFKSLIFYSTSATSHDGITNPPMVEYLVKSVGFSEDEAVSIATKVRPRFKSSAKPQPVVEFLKNSGFDETHIRRVLTCVPNLLRCKIGKTLEPKIRVFQELGLSGSNLGLLISGFPYLLNRSLKAHIVPSLEMLKSLMDSNEQLIRLLLKTKLQRMLSSYALKNLPQNFALLESYGVPRGKIKHLVLLRPLLLTNRTQWLVKTAKTVEENLGIPRTSGMFLYGIWAMGCSTSDDKLKSMVGVFKSHGWGETDISILLRRQPIILHYAEKTISAKLKYLMENLGYGSYYLATNHALLTVSVEKRIAPRNAVIQALIEKQQLKHILNFCTVVKMVESRFVKIYVLPYKDKFPELYEHYTRTMTGGALTKS